MLAILAPHDLCGADTYTNPVIDINLPDPTVICDDNGVFYMTGTGNWTRKWAEDEIANLTIYRSSDLVNWTEAGRVFDRSTAAIPMTATPVSHIPATPWPTISSVPGKTAVNLSTAI